MKKQILAILAISALSFAGTCDYSKGITAFDKRMNMTDVMKGAEKTVLKEVDDGTAVIRMRSKPVKSGKYMGLMRSEAFFFGGCKPWRVIVSYSNPETKDVASQATVFLREDGNLRAVCDGNSDVTVKNPIDGTIEPNKDCACFDENGLERDFGKFGCLYDDEIKEMIENNNNSTGGSLMGEVMRKGTKVK